MSRAKAAYRAKAEQLIDMGADFIAREVKRGEAVDTWERTSLNVLRELDEKLHQSVHLDFDDKVEQAVVQVFVGKTARIRSIVEALEKALEPGPGIPLAVRRGYPPR